MIKSWLEFIKDNIELGSSLEYKMEEINRVISDASNGENISYNWQNKDNNRLIINFIFKENPIGYDLNFINKELKKFLNNEEIFSITVKSENEGIEIIKRDILSLINLNEKKRGRPKSEKTKSGRKVPGKYLTRNKKLMKKEIEEFQGKDDYKTEWDADFKSGKGGEGKRWKTKKSPATKAYQKKFGKDKK